VNSRFVPVAITSLGEWGQDGLKFVKMVKHEASKPDDDSDDDDDTKSSIKLRYLYAVVGSMIAKANYIASVKYNKKLNTIREAAKRASHVHL
jgi:hypothetical protein